MFCDLPQMPPGPVGKFLVTQMATVAEQEAGLVGQRICAARSATHGCAPAREHCASRRLHRPPEAYGRRSVAAALGTRRK